MTVEEKIREWERLAQGRGLVLNPRKLGYIREVARIVVDKGGACPCLPKERTSCPCAEMFDDIRKMGCCHCMVFYDPDWSGEYGVLKPQEFTETVT